MYSTFTGVLISLSLLNRIYITCIAPFFDTSPIVQTSYGIVEGRTSLSRNRRTYYSFTKMPYAKPPVGEYRFAVSIILCTLINQSINQFLAPFTSGHMGRYSQCKKRCSIMHPKELSSRYHTRSWGRRRLFVYKCLYTICKQTNAFEKNEIVQVIVSYQLPDQVNNRFRRRLLPVMVFINWGGFFTGYSNAQYLGPEYFMDKDIVLVTFDYRLGVMGSYFLFFFK